MAVSPDLPDPQGESPPRSYALYRAQLSAFFARYSRSAAAAEDMVQEVYERLLRYGSNEPVKDPERYLFQIAHNVLRNAYHSAKVQHGRYLSCNHQELELFAEGVSRLWVEEDGGTDIAVREMEQVLAQLPVACRVALLRQRRDGWSYQQIADELGVSVRVVKDYITKALNHFRVHYSMGL